MFNSKKTTFISSSEFVSSGHPDRLCDNIAAFIINAIQKKDKLNSHAAIEVFITHDSVIIGGEATTTIDLSEEFLRTAVTTGFIRSGYLSEMRKYWTKEECVLPEDLTIVNKICAQSPDIALGTTDRGEESGWNDQGVYFSSSENTNYKGLGVAHLIAQSICDKLKDESIKSIMSADDPATKVVFGPDNKSVVSIRVAEDGFTPLEVTAITIAVAHSSSSAIEEVRSQAKSIALKACSEAGVPVAEDCQFVINGTGRFVVHGPVSDTSMTGRKISVNHPTAGPLWSNKMIGGGSLVKPAHASDLLLNVASRFVANILVYADVTSYAIVGCSGAIGVTGLQSLFIKGDNCYDKKSADFHKAIQEWFMNRIDWSPSGLCELFRFFEDEFDFGKAVDANFFGDPQLQTWENKKLIEEYATQLRHDVSF